MRDKNFLNFQRICNMFTISEFYKKLEKLENNESEFRKTANYGMHAEGRKNENMGIRCYTIYDWNSKNFVTIEVTCCIGMKQVL